MEFLTTAISTVIIGIILFILTRLLGNKQISQLNMWDYVIGITIGSVAAEIVVNTDKNLLIGIICMIIFAIMALLSSIITNKRIKIRRLLDGKV